MNRAGRPTRIAMLGCSVFETDARIQRAATLLTARGYEVDMFCLTDRRLTPSPSRGRLRFHRLSMSRDRSGPSRSILEYGVFFLWSLALLSVLQLRRRYRLVYVHNMPNFLVFAGLVPKLFGAKVLLDVHDPGLELLETLRGRRLPPWQRGVVRAEERISLRFSDAVITVNEPMRRRIQALSPTPIPVSVVMNLPDPVRFVDAHPKAETNGSQRLVYSGTITRRHGVDLMMRSLALLASDFPALRFTILGEGPSLDTLLGLAEKLGVAERVDVEGLVPVERIPSLVGGASAGISAQREDDFGALVFSTKVPEYIALGVPVVCAGTRTMRHYFCDDEVCFFEPGNADDLARAIREVLSDPAQTRQRQARSTGKLEQLDWAAQQDTLVSAVERLARRTSAC